MQAKRGALVSVSCNGKNGPRPLSTSSSDRVRWLEYPKTFELPFRYGADRKLFHMLGAQPLSQIVCNNRCESARMDIGWGSKRNFPKQLYTLNSEGSY